MQVILLVELTLSAMKGFFINTYIGFSIVEGLLVTLALQKEASVLQDPGVM